MENFHGFGLAAPLTAALVKLGYARPTPIQAQAIPPLMKGRDLVGIAQTGTGKTAAFALPILHKLATDRRPAPKGGARVLVLSPTRELASQIAQSFRDISGDLGLKVAVVFGGVPHGAQIRALQQGLDVLVATPGRLIDHLDARVAHLGAVEFLVLDEVDQMLDLGFIKPIRRIVRELPKRRQNLFFSATMPTDIRALAGELLNDPVEVAVTPVAKTADRVEQSVLFVEAAKKRDMLVELFGDAAMSRVLVFTRTKRGADRVAKALDEAGIDAHGHSRQQEPGPARAGARRLSRRQDAGAGRDRHRRARHRHRQRDPCRQFRTAGSRGSLRPSHRPHRAGRKRGAGDLALRPRGARSPARHRASDAPQPAQDRPARRGRPEARACRAEGRVAPAPRPPQRPHHAPHRDARSAGLPTSVTRRPSPGPGPSPEAHRALRPEASPAFARERF